jgi:hypothetical protein
MSASSHYVDTVDVERSTQRSPMMAEGAMASVCERAVGWSSPVRGEVDVIIRAWA